MIVLIDIEFIAYCGRVAYQAHVMTVKSQYLRRADDNGHGSYTPPKA